MLQILSTSNETSTGTELVQNGNFSQLGADLVENGLFDELGTDVITNGGFTGVTELVTNGDFAVSGTPNTSSWSLGWYSNTSNVEINGGSLTMSNSASETDSRAYATNGTTSNNILTTSKLYKLQYDIVENNGVTDLRYYSSGGIFIPVPSVDVGSYTIYIKNTSNQLFLFQNITTNSSISIDNVSVTEAGEDWTNGTGWSFGDSKAISTQALGSEEVTNGDFSEIGSDLVTNGDFSAAGINLVDNPNFTDTGAEMNTLPSPDVAAGSHFRFEPYSPSVVTYEGSNVTSIEIFSGGTQGAVHFVNSSYNLNDGATPLSLVSGKSYEIEITCKVNSGDFTINFASSFGNILITGVDNTEYATITTYVVYSGGSNNYFKLKDLSTGQIVSINDVSVKELGADWTLGSGWSIGDSKAICAANGGYDALNQGSVLNSGSSYKVTYTADVSLITSGTLKLSNFSELGTERAVLDGTNTVYLTANGGTFQVNEGGAVGTATITNISVQELGEGWNVVGADATHYVEFLETGARYVSPTTSPVLYLTQSGWQLLANKSYKLTVDLTRVSGGVKLEGGGITEIFNATTSGTNNTRYITPTSNIYLQFLRTTTNVDLTFHSISVQEVGQGWTLGTGWSIGEDKAIATSTGGILSQSISFVSTKNYKLTYDIVSNSGDLFIQTNVLSLRTITESGSYVDYFTTTTDNILRFNGKDSSPFDGSVTNISVKEIATSYLTQAVSLSAKTWKIIYSVSDYIAGSVSATDYGAVTTANEVGITEYVEIGAVSDFRMVNIDGYFEGAVTGISAQLVDPNGYWSLGTGWTFGDDKVIKTGAIASNLIQYNVFTSGKSYKLTFDVSNSNNGRLLVYMGGNSVTEDITNASNVTYTFYGVADGSHMLFRNVNFTGSITNISVEQVDPNDYWTLGTGWSIGTDKAISTVTGSNSDITQSILTAGKTYRTVYEIVDYTAGTAQAIVTGSDGADAVAIETYTEDLTTTGTDFSIRSKLGTFDGAVSSVSVKLLGTYEDQSIYVTAADVQTIAQDDVYYLIELTSMGSKNSLYFLPSSVVPNNGRYTKLNFTVISKDAIQQPTEGIISFYDSVGGLDTYPMGFYEFKIYEQTSSTNLDPLLATGLLEKGFAFVRDFSGNMQELTDGFKEYNPALTQYVYSK